MRCMRTCVCRAAEAIDFYRRALDAEELFRLTEPGGRIGHAEVKIGSYGQAVGGDASRPSR